MALGVALLAVLWQFLGINNFRVVNNQGHFAPASATILFIINCLRTYFNFCRGEFSAGASLRFFLLADYEPIERPIILGGKRNDFRSAIRE
jgi:hypothetical protein